MVLYLGKYRGEEYGERGIFRKRRSLVPNTEDSNSQLSTILHLFKLESSKLYFILFILFYLF